MKTLKLILLLAVLALAYHSTGRAEEQDSTLLDPVSQGGLQGDDAKAPAPVIPELEIPAFDTKATEIPEPPTPAATPEPEPDDSATLTPDLPLSPGTASPYGSDSPEGLAPGQTAPAPKEGTAEQLRRSIRIREMKTELINDPDMVFQQNLARTAKTAPGRRQALRNYYTLLYTKMAAKEPTIKNYLQQQLVTKLRSLEPSRLRPAPLIEKIQALPGSSAKDYAPPADSSTTDAPQKTLGSSGDDEEANVNE